jgi:SAM-dependent methyltransferase
MGIDLNCAQLLICAHKSGVSFERMATLGRQDLLTDRLELIHLLRKAGYKVSEDYQRRLLGGPGSRYCEAFFELLGAKKVTAIDASDFEGAEIIQDLNRPLPPSLLSCFDVVFDGGTLEHVFDFPAAIRNATKMVRPKGWFISCTMANNFCGHGFYQFSPELFYRFFSRQNGFEMEPCIIWEKTSGSSFYQVPDPDVVQSRIDLTSEWGAYLFVRARRIDDLPREFTPQQSDYARKWEGPRSGLKDDSIYSDKSGEFRSALKRIRILRSAVLWARGLVKTRSFDAPSEIRRRRISRNPRGFLTPLKGMRVMH